MGDISGFNPNALIFHSNFHTTLAVGFNSNNNFGVFGGILRSVCYKIRNYLRQSSLIGEHFNWVRRQIENQILVGFRKDRCERLRKFCQNVDYIEPSWLKLEFSLFDMSSVEQVIDQHGESSTAALNDS